MIEQGFQFYDEQDDTIEVLEVTKEIIYIRNLTTMKQRGMSVEHFFATYPQLTI